MYMYVSRRELRRIGYRRGCSTWVHFEEEEIVVDRGGPHCRVGS